MKRRVVITTLTLTLFEHRNGFGGHLGDSARHGHHPGHDHGLGTDLIAADYRRLCRGGNYLFPRAQIRSGLRHVLGPRHRRVLCSQIQTMATYLFPLAGALIR